MRTANSPNDLERERERARCESCNAPATSGRETDKPTANRPHHQRRFTLRSECACKVSSESEDNESGEEGNRLAVKERAANDHIREVVALRVGPPVPSEAQVSTLAHL